MKSYFVKNLLTLSLYKMYRTLNPASELVAVSLIGSVDISPPCVKKKLLVSRKFSVLQENLWALGTVYSTCEHK
jgi:hypothetical protein